MVLYCPLTARGVFVVKTIFKKEFVKLKKVGAESIWAIPEYYGLVQNNIPANRMKMFCKGEITMQVSGEPFVGQAALTFNQGGIRNDALVKEEKRELKSSMSTILSVFGFVRNVFSRNTIASSQR